MLLEEFLKPMKLSQRDLAQGARQKAEGAVLARIRRVEALG
jgi:hypothetical protein